MKILLLRLRLVGDVVFTTPLIHEVRRRHPHAHLSYVVEPEAAPVVAGNPHLDQVIIAPRRRGLSRIACDLALGRRLRRERFDVAIDLHGGPRSSWLAWASRAPTRIGYAVTGRTWIYTHVVARAPELTRRHSVVNQWDLLAPLGVGPCDPARHAVEMPGDAEAAERVERRLVQAGIDHDALLVVVHVSAGNPFRRWPEQSFSRLVATLAGRDSRRRILLTAGPSDGEAVRRVAMSARARLPTPDAVPLVGDWDLAELRALAARAAVYIGGDSGPTHVASTTTTPIVELLGPTLPERSRPWRDPSTFTETVDAGPLPCRPCHQRRCEPGDFRCLTGISVERVVEAAERALSGRSVGGRHA
jgi:lipopolysaccharide heptosyltransferase II